MEPGNEVGEQSLGMSLGSGAWEHTHLRNVEDTGHSGHHF